MKLKINQFIFISLLSCVAVGCGDIGSGGERKTVVDDLHSDVSSNGEFEGKGSMGASSPDDLVKISSPLLDVKSYSDFYRMRYPRLFHAEDRDNIIRLQSLGFPTQDEVNQVAALTDLELKNRFASGDSRGAIFYSERLADQIEEKLVDQGVDSVSRLVELNPNERSSISLLVVDATAAAASGLKFAPSAFSAYNYGRVNYLATGDESYIPASYAMAKDLGDAEAGRILQEMTGDKAGYSADKVLDIYRTMKVTVGR